jgi:hypothetical protein
MAFEFPDKPGLQDGFQLLDILVFRIKPFIVGFRLEDNRHAMMDILHRCAGFGGDDGT